MSSASRKVIDDCMRFSAWVAPYVDGELDPGHAVEMEAHVVGCATCAERVALLRAMRVSLRRVAAPVAPAALCAKVRATMQQERRRSGVTEPVSLGEHRLARLQYALGLAAAAGIVFSLGLSRYRDSWSGLSRQAAGWNEASSASDTASTSMSIDSLLEELVALHARPLPPDITDPDQLTRFDPLLGVQVRRPAFKPFGASFDGARVHPLADRAFLQVEYTVQDGRHLTMYVFNPRVVPIHATRLQPRIVRRHPMFVGSLRGYSVAALEQSGVGYAFASDLDTDESTQMVLAAIQQ